MCNPVASYSLFNNLSLMVHSLFPNFDLTLKYYTDENIYENCAWCGGYCSNSADRIYDQKRKTRQNAIQGFR